MGRVSTHIWIPGMQVVKQGLQAADTGMGQHRVLLQENKTHRCLCQVLLPMDFGSNQEKKCWFSEQLGFHNFRFAIGCFISHPLTEHSAYADDLPTETVLFQKRRWTLGPTKRSKRFTVYLRQWVSTFLFKYLNLSSNKILCPNKHVKRSHYHSQ